jgi:hypothetical protein
VVDCDGGVLNATFGKPNETGPSPMSFKLDRDVPAMPIRPT